MFDLNITPEAIAATVRGDTVLIDSREYLIGRADSHQGHVYFVYKHEMLNGVLPLYLRSATAQRYALLRDNAWIDTIRAGLYTHDCDTVVDINQAPTAILRAATGDIVIIDDQQYVVTRSPPPDGSRVFFRRVGAPSLMLRLADGKKFAMADQAEWVDAIKQRLYTHDLPSYRPSV